MKNFPRKTRLLALALAAATALPALCNVDGEMIVNQSGKSYKGKIRWKASEKKYEISGDGQVFSFAPEGVRINVPRPPALDKAIQDLRENRPAAVVSGLTPILDNYVRFPYDEEIASTLAQALIIQKKYDDAVKNCEKVSTQRPESAYKGKMVSAYWNALLLLNRTGKLEELLEKAIKTGDLSAVAQACVLRGDMFLQVASPSASDYRNALVDGYLRVIILYPREGKSVLPEALYKAAQCFDKMGQSSRAQKYRAQLTSGFPDSPWANK